VTTTVGAGGVSVTVAAIHCRYEVVAR